MKDSDDESEEEESEDDIILSSSSSEEIQNISSNQFSSNEDPNQNKMV